MKKKTISLGPRACLHVIASWFSSLIYLPMRRFYVRCGRNRRKHKPMWISPNKIEYRSKVTHKEERTVDHYLSVWPITLLLFSPFPSTSSVHCVHAVFSIVCYCAVLEVMFMLHSHGTDCKTVRCECVRLCERWKFVYIYQIEGACHFISIDKN